MNFIKQAAYLNDEAIVLLSAAKYRDAMRAFESALVGMQMLINAANELPLQANQTVSLPNCMVRGSIAISDFQSDQFYIYNNFLRFSHGNTFCHKDLAFYVSIILFNMALASHVEGRNTNDERVLRKALKMYQMGFEMVDEVAIDSNHAREIMVLMVNNKALIHHELGAYTQRKQDIELLSDLILGLSCYEMAIIDINVHREIKLNTFVMNQTSTAPCA